ncbi:hypothetical protein CCC_00381 [Paramagnetospirillum magnetotacticum MS-1]|uniref:SPOR domain-containing protein n=1 Tax=Paramagnetospirillum magnetotacticum MS-1 TaxID=272627 RepID=A0A0C2YRI4_PARME|nr:hypothetical protein [Paramagnetospirillum magnetotacticum]KIL97320.1 hypothetical protein CCC_00381 [Paramagnetospirillum magnetotacticum MS-1]
MTHRLSLSVLSLGALAVLGGCASTVQPAVGTWYNGTWIVTDAFPSGVVSDSASAPRGQAVSMEAGRAGDAAGRVCASPVYLQDQAPLSIVIGAAAPDWPGVADKVAVLRVECDGKPLATYAAMNDGALVTRYGAWILRLERGEKLAANPAPMMAEPAAPPMAVAPVPAPVAAPPPPPEAPRKLVYLASYKTEAWAKKGWGILAERSGTLKASEPVMKSVDLKGKGKFVRLFAGAKDDAGAKLICKELGKTIAECGVTGRD